MVTLISATPGYRGDAEKVEELIKLKANLHATDALGNSPLHLAAFNGHSKVIRSQSLISERILLLVVDYVTPLQCLA